MKVKTFLFLLVLQSAFNKSIFCQVGDSSGVYIMSLDFNMLTWSAISCEKFVQDSHPALKFRHVTNQDSLAMLDALLKKIRYKKVNDQIDVRAKLSYFKSDKVRTSICMNSNAVMINGRLIRRNKSIIAFLKSLIL